MIFHGIIQHFIAEQLPFGLNSQNQNTVIITHFT